MPADYPSGTDDERTQVKGYLDVYRDAIIRKIDGLTEEQARWKPAPTANPLINIVVHLTGVERNWFQRVIAGRDVERDRDGEFAAVPAEVTVASAIEAYRQECEQSNAVLDGISVDDRCRQEEMTELNVRWVVLHMLEETARHAGHADITRELIDGVTGP